MTEEPGIAQLRTRLRNFLAYLKPKMILGGANMDRLAQLRRMSDVRLRSATVGRNTVTAETLCARLKDGNAAGFDAVAVRSGVLEAPHLKVELPLLGAEMGYIIEAALSQNVIGAGKMESLAKAWVADAGPAARTDAPAAPAPALPSMPAPPAPLPEPVARLLGKTRGLWRMPEKAERLQDLLGKPSTGVDMIAMQIESDAGLRSRVMRFVNSACYASGTRIDSVKRAIVTLGFPTMRSLSTIASIMGVLGGKPADVPFDLKGWWEHALRVGNGAAWIARETAAGLPEDFFCAGVIHDIGKLVECSHLGPQLKQVLAAVAGGTPFEKAEQEILGTTHAVIGASLCRRWGLPESFARAVDHHLDPVETIVRADLPKDARAVTAACRLSRGPLPPADAKAWSDLTGLPAEKFGAAGNEAAKLALGTMKDVFAAS